MAELPSGTVTFLFTDIEGSTRRWDEDPEAMRPALARHDEVLRAAVEAGGGLWSSTPVTGCARRSGRPAPRSTRRWRCSRPVGRAFGDTGQLPVRMGVATGEAERRGGDYFGRC